MAAFSCKLILIVLTLVNLSESTFDINEAELVKVAQHLKAGECRKLYATLHYRRMNLDGFSGMEVPELDCLSLLTKWNEKESENKSFQLLALRLTQLGHKDIADTLSSDIFEQESQEMREAFKKFE
ncbi:hypothetical protein CAPTEDRAFT_187334 [Capitella teleta]|uniref:Death domain-containing protein n=1 Tax=Capitella teleta TaxID=283909 RepID=X1ZK55_CAPTE|nr:hypothetical protein CAPTEDRAFT_187334 [Capitella teleta]|eukprot:ELU10166.1 hypothetical protein CAPTEDRAFT_187334 [Capitella teleta]